MQHRQKSPVQLRKRAPGGLSLGVVLVGTLACGFVPAAHARITATQPSPGLLGIYDLPSGTLPKLGLADVNTRIYVPAPKDLQLEKSAQNTADAYAHYAVGSILQDSDNETLALEHFTKVLDLDPGQHELANRVAAIMVRRGDIPKALNVLKDSIKANPKEPSTYRFLSFLYHRYQKKTDLAISFAQKAISIAPESFETHATLYDIYESEGDSDKAYWVLRNAASLKVEDGDYWVQLGKALRNHLSAHPSTEAAADDERLNEVFAKAEEYSKGNVNLLDQVATFYVTTRQMDKAVALYRKILELDGSVMLVREKLAEALLNQNKKDEALEVLEGTAQIDPYRYDTFERLGELYFEAGNHEKALKYYKRCIELNPHSWQTYVVVARLQMGTNRAEDAIATTKEAQERFPENAYFVYLKAIAEASAEKFDDSLATFAVAETKMQETRRDFLDASFYFEYGASAERAKQYDRAAELFRRAITMDPEFHRAYNYLGYMWIDANQNLDEAAALVRRALDMDPGNSAYLDSLGWYYYRKGQYTEALDYLKQSLAALDEPSWEIHGHLGDTYEKLGQHAEAESEWKIALGLDTDNTDLKTKLPPNVADEVIKEAEAKKASGETAPQEHVELPKPNNSGPEPEAEPGN